MNLIDRIGDILDWLARSWWWNAALAGAWTMGGWDTLRIVWPVDRSLGVLTAVAYLIVAGSLIRLAVKNLKRDGGNVRTGAKGTLH